MPTTMKLKPGNCCQCRQGWVPGTEKTFDPGCRGCQAKLASGLRTGKEPLPVKGGLNKGPFVDVEKLRKQHAARRAMIAATPTWRVGAL
jgi:hypothetical protein